MIEVEGDDLMLETLNYATPYTGERYHEAEIKI